MFEVSWRAKLQESLHAPWSSSLDELRRYALSTYGIYRKTSREHSQKLPGNYPEQRRLNDLLGECALVLYAHCCVKKEKWCFLQNFPSKCVPFLVGQAVYNGTDTLTNFWNPCLSVVLKGILLTAIMYI